VDVRAVDSDTEGALIELPNETMMGGRRVWVATSLIIRLILSAKRFNLRSLEADSVSTLPLATTAARRTPARDRAAGVGQHSHLAKTLPVLQASHIKPYAQEGPHDPRNGLAAPERGAHRDAGASF